VLIRGSGVVLLAAAVVAGCSWVHPRAVPAHVTAAASAAPPIWIETPQMTSRATGWTLRWLKWGVNDSQLVRTTDGGRTWTDVTPPAAAALLSLPDLLAAVLLARDSEHAWLALCCAGGTATSAGMLTEVFSTSDGGRRWTESGPLHGPAYGGPASLTFTGPEDGWLLFTTEPAGPARFGQLYRTEDGGRHWALLAAGVPATCDPSPLLAATRSVAWIECEPGGPLLVSRDGGTRWVPQPVPRTAVGVLQLTGQTGIMTAGPASGLYLLVTRDLGRTWRRVPLPSGIGQFPGVRFLSASDGIVMPQVSAGSRVPVVYVTVNGGRTWTAVPQGLHATDPELLGYDFVSTRIWFAWYGNNAGALSPPAAPAQALASIIYQTDNSGRTWTAITART
jgi:photosystem II stability/assembly factor-like uncharacterized protein